MVVGITDMVDRELLTEEVASQPISDNYFEIATFADLEASVEK